ncbi:MAG: aspartyl protease family protein [Prosthecobacter sp.]
MIRGFLTGFLTAYLLAGCSVSHGPVSVGTMARLNDLAVTPEQGARMMNGRKIATRSHPPSGGVVRMAMKMDDAGLPTVKVSLNGRRAEDLLLDTGATVTVLDAALAVRNRIATVPGVRPEMAGVMGSESGMGAVIETMQIGPWRLDNLPCVVRLQRSSAGLDFLSSDFAISVLGFHLAQKHCSHLTLDYPRRTVEFGFGGFRGPTSPNHKKASFRLKCGVPMIRVSVGKISWDAIVDTGSCFGIEINQKLAQRLGCGTGGQVILGNFVMIGVGGATTPEEAGVRVITVPRLSMMGSTFSNAPIDVMPGPARIGSYFLQKYRVTFDFRRQLVWLER